MPLLPAPLPLIPAGGAQPVSSTDDVLVVFPAESRQEATAPVRDAIVEMLTSTALAYQVSSAYAAAQSDVTRATGICLDGQLGDRGVPRQSTETDTVYRTRALASPVLVSPSVILEAVNALLLPHTAIKAQLFPCILDQMYLHDGTGDWHNFLWDGPGEDPDYGDRYYDQRVQAHPGNNWLFTEYLLGRGFVLRVPLLGGVEPVGPYLTNGTVVADDGFLGDGSDTAGAESDGSVATFLYIADANAMTAYASIVGTVEALRGHGIRWELWVDPYLN